MEIEVDFQTPIINMYSPGNLLFIVEAIAYLHVINLVPFLLNLQGIEASNRSPIPAPGNF